MIKGLSISLRVFFLGVLLTLISPTQIKAQFTYCNPYLEYQCVDQCVQDEICLPQAGTVCQWGFICVYAPSAMSGVCIPCDSYPCSTNTCSVYGECCPDFDCVSGSCVYTGGESCTQDGLTCDETTGEGPDGPCCEGLECIEHPYTGVWACTVPGQACVDDSNGECRAECQELEEPLLADEGGPDSDCADGLICCIPVPPPPPPDPANSYSNSNSNAPSAGDFDSWIQTSTPNFENSNVGSIISAMLPYIFCIAGLLILLNSVLGGYQIMVSESDPKRMAAGREKITNAVIGFIILFVAYWLVQLVAEILDIQQLRDVFA